MSSRSVFWHEGMFLWPQHNQLEDRFRYLHLTRGHKWDVHYNWGLRALDLDLGALKNFLFVVRKVQARLRDGTMVSVPEDAALGSLDLKDVLGQKNQVTIFLAVPLRQAGRANVPDPDMPPPKSGEGSEKSEPEETRWLIENQEMEDENTGEDPQPIQVRVLNVKLLLSTQNLAGYETVPLARIAKTSEGPPQLDVTYIPPILACEAWKPLQEEIMQAIFHRLGSRMEALAQQTLTRGITFDTHNPGDRLLLAQLQALNEAAAVLQVLAFAEGVHPLPAYLELCRLAGRLAIFSTSRRAPDLPRYDHDDLGTCFYRVKQYIESFEPPPPTYEERPFIGEALRIQVSLDPKWLEPGWQMFVGVQSPLKREECISLLTRRGRAGLDMKIGSSTSVDEIFEKGFRGLEFAAIDRPPRALPAQSGLVYFQVNRSAQQDEWKNVQQTFTLAIRLNQNLIQNLAGGNLQGQRNLEIKTGSNAIATLQFTLFLVPLEG